MFLGQYSHSIDGKGRMIVPARFRELLSGGAFITRGFDRNLMVLTSSSFETITQRVGQMTMTDQATRQLRRLIFANADRVDLDKAGRIRIPSFLLTFSELDNEALIVGVGDYFEIWSPKSWDEQASLLEDTDANAQRFAALDISAGQQ